MVEYSDRAVMAELGVSDMRIPIQYAITYPERADSPAESLDLAKIGRLTFFTPDRESFPLLALAESAAQKKGILPCVMNAANEQTVSLFLSKKIRFSEIFSFVDKVTASFDNIPTPSLSDIEWANKEARIRVISLFNETINSRSNAKKE